MEKLYEKEEFQTFLRNLFIEIGIKEKNLRKVLTESTYKNYARAFTHSSIEIDPINNYEKYEFIGDSVVNLIIATYVSKTYPNVNDSKWLTRIKHYLVSNKILAEIMFNLGLVKYIQIEKAFPLKFENIVRDENRLKILGDIFESFIGCTLTVFEDLFGMGVGYTICDRVINNFLSEQKIKITSEMVYDPITRLKETYESKELGLKWPNEKIVETKSDPETKLFTSIVYGWPKGDKKVFEKNKEQLGFAQNKIKSKAEYDAAKMAIDKLFRMYNITIMVPQLD